MGKSLYISLLLCLVFSANLLAQNRGSYVFPYNNHRIEIKEELKSEKEIPLILDKYIKAYDYPAVSFELETVRKSIASKHYTYQVLLEGLPVELAKVKLHVSNGQANLLQHNLPSKAEWKTLQNITSSSNENSTWLIVESQCLLAEKRAVILEPEDYYAHTFHLSDGSYFENIMKYHIDSIAYAKIFNPDPLSTAGVGYGGNYQDAYIKDTAAILIQSKNNPGGNTITFNASNFTFEGQTFNIPTESYVNSSTSPSIHQVFEDLILDGQGTILGFNTAITDDLASYNTEIRREDYNFPELAAEQEWKSMPLDFSGGTFNLTNDFFIISEFSNPFTNPAMSTTDSFDYTRNEVQFEDVNAFYHLNNYKTYWESLGFTDLATELILIDAHGNNGADNSFFTPTSPPRLVFGQGGVDDAEDADVIIHEYGHGLSHFASPNTNSGDERRALDEGFGDYLAFSYSRALTPFNAFNVFSWDGHNEFWDGRVANSPKTALDIDLGQGIYYNGEIWSASLKDLRSALGKTITDQLAIEVMYYNMPNGTLSQAALNLFDADTALYNGIHSCDIFQVLFGRKFLTGSCTDFTIGIADNYSLDGKVLLKNSYAFTYRNEDLIIYSEGIDLLNSNLQVWDLNGKLIQESYLQQNYYTLEGSKYSPGVYFITVRTKDSNYRFKILKN